MSVPDDVGIRHKYPRIPLPVRFREYAALTRPFTLLAPIIGVLATLGAAVATNHASWAAILGDWRFVVHGTVTLLIVQVASNYYNQAVDREDEVNRPYRPTVTGEVTREEVRSIALFLWFASLLRAGLLDPAFGVITLGLITSSYAYSAPWPRLKARTWWGNVAVSTARGGLGVPAAWTLVASPFAWTPWVMGGILFLFLVGATTAKDFADMEGDREYGVRTLPVNYGPRRAAILSAPFVFTPVFTVPLADTHGYIVVPDWSYALIGVPLAILLVAMLQFPTRRNAYLEGSWPWPWKYLTLMGLMVAFGVNGYIPIIQ